MLKKIGKKKDNDVNADVAQLERSNNKYYTSAFRYIQINIQIQIYIKKKKDKITSAHTFLMQIASSKFD